MHKKIILAFFFVAGLIAAGYLININGQKNSLPNPITAKQEAKEISPSQTFIDYADPSGFTFSYPDNLSITKADSVDNATYADLQLTNKQVSGSLNFKISDSKYKTIDDWAKLNKGVTKETKLGNLKAMEIKTNDRLLLGALDQGIFFTIEVPLIEEKFWSKVYNKMLASFSFSQPVSSAQTDTSSNDVSFESEEVVE